ncbi:hypothetical protein [Luteolibacter marinus]|uniref:hypothetical protein n=1 Tax=Luteolibacter marinus TaxID=2776705 RepID=UPI001868E1B8|nr:hypothetical protein [Luteolibacter marinus]
MNESIPFNRFFSPLPALLKVSWLALGTGFLLLATGYALRRESWSIAGGALFLAGYGIGVADLRYRRHQRDKAAGFHLGIAVAPIAAGYFHLFMLLTGLLGAGITAVISDLDRGLMLRLLHFWVVSLAFAVFLMLTRIARRPASHPGR